MTRMGFVFYNLQVLTNHTEKAIVGLSEQLAAASLMALQNCIALAMVLAEQGGVGNPPVVLSYLQGVRGVLKSIKK